MNIREIEQALDSDDELPTSYNEMPIPSAYENDNRFDNIIFKWINDSQKNTCFSEVGDSQTPGKSNQNYITRGFLNKQDLFCLKSVANALSDDTFLWFVDFLVRKDMQSRCGNNFKSCLIEEYPHKHICNNYENLEQDNLNKKNYKIVVKVNDMWNCF